MLKTEEFDYYLIRIVGENGRISYVGPRWFEYLRFNSLDNKNYFK